MHHQFRYNFVHFCRRSLQSSILHGILQSRHHFRQRIKKKHETIRHHSFVHIYSQAHSNHSYSCPNHYLIPPQYCFHRSQCPCYPPWRKWKTKLSKLLQKYSTKFTSLLFKIGAVFWFICACSKEVVSGYFSTCFDGVLQRFSNVYTGFPYCQ